MLIAHVGVALLMCFVHRHQSILLPGNALKFDKRVASVLHLFLLVVMSTPGSVIIFAPPDATLSEFLIDKVCHNFYTSQIQLFFQVQNGVDTRARQNVCNAEEMGRARNGRSHDFDGKYSTLTVNIALFQILVLTTMFVLMMILHITYELQSEVQWHNREIASLFFLEPTSIKKILAEQKQSGCFTNSEIVHNTYNTGGNNWA